MTLVVKNLKQSYGTVEILRGVTFEAEPGMISLIGPNGAGKTTLVKSLAGLMEPEGEAYLNGVNLVSKSRDKGVKTAYMPQENPRPLNTIVLEAVLMGLASSLSWRVTAEETNRAYRALEILGISELAEKRTDFLSGGQLQMVMVAQCLVSNPEFILLDEPANNLDMRKELDLFERISNITYSKKKTTLAVLHDINFASRYSDTIVVLEKGVVHSYGPPGEIVTEKMLLDVFGVEAEVYESKKGSPMVFPIRSVGGIK